ncbi:hypothetical protein [Hydrogenimonas sp.]
MTWRPLFSLLAAMLVMIGCSERPVTKRYQAASKEPPTCLRLEVRPFSEPLDTGLRALYPFRSDCPVTLEVRHKENICCNSTQNVQRKTLSEFPRHFLRLEVRRGLTPLYSYYIDLDHPADADDAKRAFARLRRDLNLRP